MRIGMTLQEKVDQIEGGLYLLLLCRPSSICRATDGYLNFFLGETQISQKLVRYFE
jgi:hypothetical protein